MRATKILVYLAEQRVNGPDHPGAIGPPPSKYVPPPPEVPEALRGAKLTGWRDIYVEKGPEAWAKAVRAHKGVLLTDTTWCALAGFGFFWFCFRFWGVMGFVVVFWRFRGVLEGSGFREGLEWEVGGGGLGGG